MIRRVRLFVAPLVMLAVLLPMMGGTASAEPALKISTDNCSLFDGNGALVAVTPISSTDLFTRNSTRDVIAKCQANVTPPDNGNAMHFDYASTGFPCTISDGTYMIQTEDWHETLTPNGRATITCHFKSPVVVPAT